MAKRLVIIIIALAPGAQAYHNGGDETNCWLGPNYRELVHPCPVAKIDFVSIPNRTAPTALFTNQAFSVVAKLNLLFDNIAVPDDAVGGHLVPHANIHMCKAELGWCTPDVRVQPGLATQSPEVKSNSFILAVNNLIVPSAGDWTIVAHFSVTVNNTNGKAKWDVAAGFKLRFQAEFVREDAAPWAILLCQVLASLGIALSLLALCLVVVKRNHWVFKSSTPSLSALMAIGCLIAFIAVFVLPPPPLSPNAEDSMDAVICASRIWLLSLAFDLVLVPFALRTWRVYKLFASGTGFKRKAITDAVLIKCGGAVIFLDALFCLTWTLAWPLHTAKIPFAANPLVVYSLQCSGDNQRVLEIFSFLFHGLPLLWLARVGHQVRRSFQQRALLQTSSDVDKAKMAYFNESEAISQTLLSLGCVSLFAIALQYTVQDNPTAVLLMVSFGVLWSAYFTLALNFLPRALKLFRFEKDGVTKRDTGTDVNAAATTSKV